MFIFHADDWVPDFLLKDRNGYALAMAIEAGLNRMNSIVQEGLAILDDVDKMPEWRLDELAWETNCFYDYNAAIEAKREMIRSSAQMSRRAGTPYAIEAALGAIYPGSQVQEADEYEGLPFHFRIRINLNETEAENERDRLAREAIAYYKNVRSVSDGTSYHRERAIEHELYTGLSLFSARRTSIGCDIPPGFDATYLTDAQGNMLLDGLGNRLIDSEE